MSLKEIELTLKINPCPIANESKLMKTPFKLLLKAPSEMRLEQ